jgi:hydroxysqualene synthase
MSGAAELRSSTGHRDENVAVASLLIKAEHRRRFLAFYDFVRTADDIADHPTVFPMDITTRRSRNWELPVGRFTLDLHGEPEATWLANDARCATLPINNQRQDCHADNATCDRFSGPLGARAEAGATIEDLGAPRSSPALRRCRRALAVRTAALLQQGNGSASLIGDVRRSLEVAAITAMAWQILGLIKTRDPLSENVHLTKFGAMRSAVAGMAAGSLARLVRGRFASRKTRTA